MEGLNTTALLIVGGVTLLAFTVDYFLGFKPVPGEPPVVKPTIQKHKMPIFTIPMLTSRTYVITDADLAQATQRSSKTISFSPFVEQLTKALFDVDKRQFDIITKDLIGPNADKGMVNSVTRDMHAALSPGKDLDEMNQKMLDTLAPYIENIKPDENGMDIDLHDWIKEIITIVSTDAFYGQENPFRDPEVQKAFWYIEENAVGLALPGAKYFARNAYQGRETLVKAYAKYFDNHAHDTDGAKVIQVRYHGHMRYPHVVHSDNARFEIGTGFGLLANSVPATFWYLLYAFSDPSILSELRTELDSAMTVESTNGTTTRTLDVSKMRSSCPLFVSLFQEVLRCHSTTALNRKLTDDLTFANRYTLKKDAMVAMPSAVTHFQESIWGDDAERFDAKRMLKRKLVKENGATAGEKAQRLHPAGFRAFGAAPWLCPGRHFATTEICVFIAVLLARFDIVPLDASGAETNEWKFPKRGASILSSVLPPATDIKARLRPRKGANMNDKLKLIISEGGGSFPLPV